MTLITFYLAASIIALFGVVWLIISDKKKQ